MEAMTFAQLELQAQKLTPLAVGAVLAWAVHQILARPALAHAHGSKQQGISSLSFSTAVLTRSVSHNPVLMTISFME